MLRRGSILPRLLPRSTSTAPRGHQRTTGRLWAFLHSSRRTRRGECEGKMERIVKRDGHALKRHEGTGANAETSKRQHAKTEHEQGVEAPFNVLRFQRFGVSPLRRYPPQTSARMFRWTKSMAVSICSG